MAEPDFEKMYFELFNGITTAIDALKNLQIKAEESFISCGDNIPLCNNEK